MDSATGGSREHTGTMQFENGKAKLYLNLKFHMHIFKKDLILPGFKIIPLVGDSVLLSANNL